MAILSYSPVFLTANFKGTGKNLVRTVEITHISFHPSNVKYGRIPPLRSLENLILSAPMNKLGLPQVIFDTSVLLASPKNGRALHFGSERWLYGQ
jgi:hypothetical protein